MSARSRQSEIVRAAGAHIATPTAAPDIPATAHLALISTLPGLQALETQWRELERNSATPLTVFQSFDWISAWSETYAAQLENDGLLVLTGFDHNRLVFLWPLMVRKRLGLKVLTWLTEPFGQYGDVICCKDQCPRLWIGNSLRFLARLRSFDLVRLRHVRADGALAAAASAGLMDARNPEQAPYLDLTAFKSEGDYEARYSPVQRKRRRKIRKHLARLGPLTFAELPVGSVADAAIVAAIAEKNKWLAERGRINRVLGCPGHGQFLKRLSRVKPQGLAVVVTELRAGGKPVSWEIGFRYGKAHFAYITSHVNALTDLSPGRLHMDLSQRACLAAGCETFDLMVPYDAHKESWSSASMPTRDCFLPLSPYGWLAGHFYLRMLRPLLRALYYRLPPSVLRMAGLFRRG